MSSFLIFIPIVVLSAILRHRAVEKKNGNTQSASYNEQSVEMSNPATYNTKFKIAIRSLIILIVVLFSSISYFKYKFGLIDFFSSNCFHPEGEDLIGFGCFSI